MPKFGDLGSKCSKTSVKFEISTFEIGYIQNFVKIRELILFGPKIPKFGPLGLKFSKANDKFAISTFKIKYM